MNKFLKLKNIFKSFKTEKNVKVLKGLSQSFEKGKIYSIIEDPKLIAMNPAWANNNLIYYVNFSDGSIYSVVVSEK